MNLKTGHTRLEDLPNIGKSIAADLRTIGILSPDDLRKQKPVDVFDRLKPVMGTRHDPCVLHTLLSVEHHFSTGETLPWWKFTAAGKEILSRR